MDHPPPAVPGNPGSGARSLADLDADSLSHCTSFLDIRDIANLAVTCKHLRQAAYSDSVWRRLYSERWRDQSLSSGLSGIRDVYLARRTALLQLKFEDPAFTIFSFRHVPCSHILLNRNHVFVAQGSTVGKFLVGERRPGFPITESQRTHSARITCMRLFPMALTDTQLYRSEMTSEDDILVTSSADRTIRLWWKGRSHRCFKGHNGPVTTLADRLLGDCAPKLLASGGEDCTVRLWSMGSSGKSHPLMATYYGHEKPVSFLSVAGHKTSLLVSISKDSKVRVWDSTVATSSGSPCVGMASLSSQPVGMKCHDALCYCATGSSVVAIDLRSMQKVLTATHPPRIQSFEMLPSKGFICTGGEGKAMLWDIRKSQVKPEPFAELDSQTGSTTLLHMDPYKVVTGGPSDCYVHVYETDTGFLAKSLDCRVLDETEYAAGVSAMAVDGCRIVTNICTGEPGDLYFRDYSNCAIPSLPPQEKSGSKFWEGPASHYED